MKLDDRDEALGAVLDRSFEGVGRSTPPEPTSVMRRGTRHRASVLVASFVTVAVFVGVIGFAASQFGRDPRTTTWAGFGSTDVDGWAIDVPPSWNTQHTDRCPPSRDVAGAIFSSVPFTFVDPDGGAVGCEQRLVMEGFPTDGVALAILPTGMRIGIFDPEETVFPLSLGSLEESGGIREGPRELFNLVTVKGRLKANLRVFVGPDASQGSTETLQRMLESLRFRGMSVWVSEQAGPSPFSVGVSYPNDWRLNDGYGIVFDSTVQPILRLRSSPDISRGPVCGEWAGRPSGPAVSIGKQPLRPEQAVITVEAFTGAGWTPPRHPPDFRPLVTPLTWDDAQIASEPCTGGRSHWATFYVAQGGTDWILNVAMGNRVLGTTAGSTVLDVLNRLRLGWPEAETESATDPVRFDAAEGWEERSDPGSKRFTPATAWAANVSLPVEQQPGLESPDGLIESLAEDDVFIVASQVGDEPPEADNPNFPPMSLPLLLPAEVESSWESGVEGKGRTALWANINGRAIQIRIFYGTPDPSEEVRAEAAAALARLQVEPFDASPEPVELPPPTTDEFRSEFVSDEEGYRFWPISGSVEPGVVYRFDVPHCGLEWLTGFDGSFWRPIDPNQPEPEVPSFFFNADRGTMALVAPNTAEYVSSAGRVVMLVRLDGPIVRQLCE